MAEKPTKSKAVAPDPTLTEVSISFSFGTKMNLGSYESADVHVSRSERWDVSGLGDEAAQALYDERYNALQESVMGHVNAEYTSIKGG